MDELPNAGAFTTAVGVLGALIALLVKWRRDKIADKKLDAEADADARVASARAVSEEAASMQAMMAAVQTLQSRLAEENQRLSLRLQAVERERAISERDRLIAQADARRWEERSDRQDARIATLVARLSVGDAIPGTVAELDTADLSVRTLSVPAGAPRTDPVIVVDYGDGEAEG